MVGVIIPTYNRAELVSRAIESVRCQTWTDWKLTVVDDGSTDGTDRVIDAFLSDSRITYLRQQRRGVSAARNRGLEKSSGRWVCFLDSDDYWLPDKLSRQLDAVAASPVCQVCYTNEIWIRRGVRVNPKKKHRKYGGWIYDRCLPLCIISPSSALLDREVLGESPFDETLPACEDYDLWLRIAARRPVCFLDEELIVKTGGHADQLSRRFWGLDRFRLRSLAKMFESGILTPLQARWTAAEAARKASILAQGFQNRGKREEAEEYSRQARAWARLAEQFAWQDGTPAG